MIHWPRFIQKCVPCILINRMIDMKKFLSLIVALQTVFFSSMAFAEEAVENAPRDQGMMQTFMMIAIALVFFYLILWRPEQKRRKALETQRSSMKKGDKVTAMGIVGTLVRVDEHTVILRMYDGSKIEMLKAAISDVVPGTEEEAKKVENDDKKLG